MDSEREKLFVPPYTKENAPVQGDHVSGSVGGAVPETNGFKVTTHGRG